MKLIISNAAVTELRNHLIRTVSRRYIMRFLPVVLVVVGITHLEVQKFVDILQTGSGNIPS